MAMDTCKRNVLKWSAVGAGVLLLPSTSWALTRTPAMTEGPFYPEARDLLLDQDNDLTTIAGKPGVAAGVIVDIVGRVRDVKARAVAGAVVEIWQCNAHGRYHHAGDTSGAPLDPFFQGFGKTTTDAAGNFRFRTIKPVAYAGRTPHIHFKVKSSAFDELTSQAFIEGEPANARDFVLRAMSKGEMQSVMLKFAPAASPVGAKLYAQFEIVVGR